jgi:predicted component of type VI protein secretion system
MNVQLILDQRGRRKVLKLKPPVCIIGRSHGNTVRIPSADVSRQHCRLLMEDGLVTVEDLDSVNGTFLNGRRLREAEVVRPGDSLEVGPVTFLVEYVLTPEAQARLEGNENPAELLAALAEGEDLDEEAAPLLEELEELAELPAAEPEPIDELLPIEEELEPVEELQPVEELEPVEDLQPVEELEPIAEETVDFDSKPWAMPDQGDLRDILSQMEDEEPPTRHTQPKKRR